MTTLVTIWMLSAAIAVVAAVGGYSFIASVTNAIGYADAAKDDERERCGLALGAHMRGALLCIAAFAGIIAVGRATGWGDDPWIIAFAAPTIALALLVFRCPVTSTRDTLLKQGEQQGRVDEAKRTLGLVGGLHRDAQDGDVYRTGVDALTALTEQLHARVERLHKETT